MARDMVRPPIGLMVDARAKTASLGWYPGLAIVISVRGLTSRRSQSEFSGERTSSVRS